MGYNILDIINKAIDISHMRKRLYLEINAQNYQSPSVKILSKVLADNVDKSIIYYEKLKKEVDENIELIDLVIYDRISFLINQFNLRIHTTNIASASELLSFSLNLESEVLALFLDIQGRLVKNQTDTNSDTYLILSDMIKAKTSLIHDLEHHH